MVVIETVVDNEDTNASTSNNVEIGGGIDAVVNEIVNVSTSIIGEIGGGINKEIEIEELIIPTIITDKVTDINFGKIYSTVLCSNCYSLEEQVDSLRGEVQLSVASWKCAAEENDKMKEYVLDLQRMQQEKDTTLLTKVKQQQKIEEEYKTLIRKMSQENSEKLEIAKNAMVSMKTQLEMKEAMIVKMGEELKEIDNEKEREIDEKNRVNRQFANLNETLIEKNTLIARLQQDLICKNEQVKVMEENNIDLMDRNVKLQNEKRLLTTQNEQSNISGDIYCSRAEFKTLHNDYTDFKKYASS